MVHYTGRLESSVMNSMLSTGTTTTCMAEESDIVLRLLHVLVSPPPLPQTKIVSLSHLFLYFILRVQNTKSVQLPAQPLYIAVMATLHITWHGLKGYTGKQCKVTPRKLNPKQGCTQPCIYYATGANNVYGFITRCEVLTSQTS